MIKLLETGLVYRNPKPSHRSIHAWHPTLVDLGSGELLCGFDLAEAIQSVNYRTYLSRSTDHGQTWGPPVRLFQDESDRLQRHTMRMSRMRDGTLIAMGGRRHMEHENEEVFNSETFGQLPMQVLLLRSGDDGHTWQGPTIVSPPLPGPFEVCHAVVELADGQWLWPTSTLRKWDGEAPNGVRAMALVSHDKGQSWPESIDILDAYAEGIMHMESSLVQLSDARLLSVSWTFDFESGKSRPLQYAVSDQEQAFSPAKPTGISGETSKLLCLDGDRIFCVCRRYDQPGLWANLARIESDRWVNLAETPLWQGAESKMVGQQSAAQELDSLQFGFPQPHLLADGTVMVVFWCREDCIHNIRWLHVAVA
jgi:hypothetical protein